MLATKEQLSRPPFKELSKSKLEDWEKAKETIENEILGL